MECGKAHLQPCCLPPEYMLLSCHTVKGILANTVVGVRGHIVCRSFAGFGGWCRRGMWDPRRSECHFLRARIMTSSSFSWTG